MNHSLKKRKTENKTPNLENILQDSQASRFGRFLLAKFDIGGLFGSLKSSLEQVESGWKDIRMPEFDWIDRLFGVVNDVDKVIYKLRQKCPDCGVLEEQYDAVYNDYMDEIFEAKKKIEKSVKILDDIQKIQTLLEEAKNDKEETEIILNKTKALAQDYRKRVYSEGFDVRVDEMLNRVVKDIRNLGASIEEEMEKRIETYRELQNKRPSPKKLQSMMKTLESNFAELESFGELSHEWIFKDSAGVIVQPGYTPPAESSLTKRRKPKKMRINTYICRKCGIMAPYDINIG